MKVKVFKIISIVFLVFAAINIVGGFFLGLGIFAKDFKSDSYNKDDDYDIRNDSVYLYKQKIAKYQEKLDSLLEINPLQAELFTDKLMKKYKQEQIFFEYKAFSLYKQNEFQKAITFYKIANITFSEFFTDKNRINRNIALCFENIKEFDSAIYYFKKASIDVNLYSIARCFNHKKEKDSALFYYSKLLEIMKNDKDKMNYIKNIDVIDEVQYKVDSLSKFSK